jgi:hypothetical protein
MEINCIMCSVGLENWDIYPNKTVIHPIGGTVFRAYGNYGSSVFDPMDASYLDIVICDECLKDRLHHAHEGVNIEYIEQLGEDILSDWKKIY